MFGRPHTNRRISHLVSLVSTGRRRSNRYPLTVLESLEQRRLLAGSSADAFIHVIPNNTIEQSSEFGASVSGGGTDNTWTPIGYTFSDSATAAAGGNTNASISATASVSIASDEQPADWAAANSSTSAKWSDRIYVAGSPTLEEQPYIRLTFSTSHSKGLEGSRWYYGDIAIHAEGSNGVFSTSEDAVDFFAKDPVYGDRSTSDIESTFVFDVPLSPQDEEEAAWSGNYSINISSQISSNESAISVGASVSLVSAKLLDGSDPDSIYYGSKLGDTPPPQPGKIPDLIADSLVRTADGGVDFSYSVAQAPLPRGTNVSLFWASGSTFDSVIGGPISSDAAQTAVGSYGPFHVGASTLGSPPQGATHLLLVVDPPSASKPSGEVAESDESNNFQALEIGTSDLKPADLHWDVSVGGVDFSYKVGGGNLPDNSSVDFYWASGPSTADEIGGPALTASVADTPGTYGPTFEGAAGLGPAPQGAKYLLAVPSVGGKEVDANAISVAYDPFDILSATSPDPKDITFTYDVNEDSPASNQPLAFGVYRSSSSTFDPSIAILVNNVTTDVSGNVFSEDLGKHTVTVHDPDALLPDPLHEHVYVVADPKHLIGDPDGVFHEAHYRKFVLGVVSHGLLPTGQVTGVPDWETQMAQDLLCIDGFNQVIPFDWSNTSNLPLPGLATAAGDRLATQIQSAADALVKNLGQPDDVVDLDLIGHSRGAVVISRALQDLDGTTDKVLAGGYVKMTVLDPHPANNNYGLASFDGLFGVLEAGPSLLAFQGTAVDPQVVIPPNVDAWDDIYQNTPSTLAFGLIVESLMNLWGDDPSLINNESGVRPTLDENLRNQTLPSGDLIGHSEVPLWYDQIDVQLRLIFPGYPLPGQSAASDAMESPANIVQNSVQSQVSASATPPPTVTTQTAPAEGTPSGPPAGNELGMKVSSPASAPTVVDVPIPSASPSRPAQASSKTPQTQAIGAQSWSPLPLPKPSPASSRVFQAVPTPAQGHANPIVSTSVAMTKPLQTQIVRGETVSPLHRRCPLPPLVLRST